MRFLALLGSTFLATGVSAFFIFASAVEEQDVSAGWAAVAIAASTLLLAFHQASMLVRSVAYASARVDSGRKWVARRRQLVAGPALSGGRMTVLKRMAFAVIDVVIGRRTPVAASVVVAVASALLLFLALTADLARTVSLMLALSLVALVVAATAVSRAVLGAILFASGVSERRMLVALGKMSATRPSIRSVRALGARTIVRHIWDPVPVAIAILALTVPVMIAVGADGIEVGVVVAALTVHLGMTNVLLFRSTREWWCQLAASSIDRGGEANFTRGIFAPTSRVLVDIITPIGPASPVHELGGVLSDHRSLASASCRWTVVTDPDRLDEVDRYLQSLFEMHGASSGVGKVRVIASPSPKAGPKRNLGAEQATAPFVCFVDSDDRLDLQRLEAAICAALQSERALQSVHLFPFHFLTVEGMEMRTPAASHTSLIAHHHCARLWPSGIFRAGLASYSNADFEDAILTLEMSTTLDHQVHRSTDTAFLTYADHREDEIRLTRASKDSTKLLRGFVDQAVAESEAADASTPGPREKALTNAFVGRVAAEVAWRRYPLAQLLEAAFEEFSPYRRSRSELNISADHIESQIAGVRRRIGVDGRGGSDCGLVNLLRDEFSSKVPRATTLHSPTPNSARPSLATDLDLGLLVGLMNFAPKCLRNRSDSPTIFYNLSSETLRCSRRVLSFFVRSPYFRLEADESLPDGAVDVLDPATKSRTRLGSFETDRLMSSKLLRLAERFYPSINQVEQARAHVVLQSLGLRSEVDVVRLVATGPSSSASLDPAAFGEKTVTICCNSWVRQPERMAEMGARILTAGDPIFHAGPSEYARQFRADLTAWLRSRPDHLFITVARDIAVYLAELPLDVHDQVIAPVFDGAIDPGVPVSIDTGRIQPYPNVMTMLMLPMAELFEPSEIQLFGFDGGAKGAEEYWGYDPEINYSEELQQTVRNWHPEFFRVDYQGYRDDHEQHVAGWAQRLEGRGIRLRAAAPSNIPAVDSAYRATLAGKEEPS